MHRSLFALLCLLVLGAAAPARDWRKTVVESESGWTFGRPGAPLLAEYASFGCPHCGHFAADVGPAIDQAVKAGKIRLSFRPYLIFPHDRAASVLARCAAPARRLAFIKTLFAEQADTKSRLKAADADDAARGRLYEAELAGPERHASAIADVAGLINVAERHGLTRQQAESCLADAKQHEWVGNAHLAAQLAGITGTPTYVWKGARLPRTLTPEELTAQLPR